MKTVFILLLAGCWASSMVVAQTPLTADRILKEARAEARNSKKNVFVIFHASWCIWCHKMDSSMNDQACKKFFDDSYVIRHLVVHESKDKKNLENPGSIDLLTKYGGSDMGIPFWLIFDQDGKLLADSKISPAGTSRGAVQNCGCPAAKEEVSYFISVLRKTSDINSQQAAIIEKRFRQNE
jgi:thioredoxin-related protein